MTALRSPRWALSFADLCLLLLGFFVMLQAQGHDARVAGSLRAAFGETGASTPSVSFRADRLFEPREAVLLPRERARLAARGRAAAAARAAILLTSQGAGAGTSRLDAWELSAARVGAIARALREGGLPEKDIRIVMPPVEREAQGGQLLSLTTLPPTR